VAYLFVLSDIGDFLVVNLVGLCALTGDVLILDGPYWC
jgi:hypothetical protein